MIRHATDADIPRILELGKRMHDESPNFCGLPWDAEKVEATVLHLMDSPSGFVRVAESGGVITGGMMAVAIPHWASSALVACDLALFIDPAHRGGMAAVRLLSAYRAWAIEVGATITQLGIMTGVKVDATEGLCSRLGWRRTGVVMEAPACV